MTTTGPYDFNPEDDYIDDDEATIYEANGVVVMVRGYGGLHYFTVRVWGSASPDAILSCTRVVRGEQLRTDLPQHDAEALLADFTVHDPRAADRVRHAFEELEWL